MLPTDHSQRQHRLVGALGDAVASYDRSTFEHSTRVGKHAYLVGQVLGLDELQLDALGWAGLLHDLGKLAVPEEILTKTDRLTPAEWDQVRVHPVVGQQLLMALSDRMEPVASAVRAHHERWDGGGYPDGLAGEDIPLLGRIVAVADVFDALTHTRSYRPGRYTMDEALALMRAWSGSHFDPDVISVFLGIIA